MSKRSLFLKNCKICKHDVAWNAKKCLNCGVANPTTTWKHKLAAFVLVMMAVAFCAVPSKKGTSPEVVAVEKDAPSAPIAPKPLESEQPRSFDEYAMGSAMQICEIYIKGLLLAPRSADFAFLDRRGSQEGEVVTVNSYVEAQNQYGAKVRSDFVCKIKFPDKNMDDPQLEDLTFSNESVLK